MAGYDLPILETRISQRIAYPGSAASGTTVLESEPSGEAASDIRSLLSEIRQKFI